MKINGIEIKKDLIAKKIKKDSKPKKDSEKDPFSEKMEEYHNKLVNKYGSDEFGIEVGLFSDLERIYVVDMDGRINEDEFYSDAYKFANQCGLDIIIGKRSGFKNKLGKPIKQVWDIFFVEDGERYDSKLKKDSVKDDISNEARELCREIKSLTEEDVKDSTVLIGEWKLLPYDPEKHNDGYYTAVNVETGELLSDDDFEKLKSAIKYTIYSDDRYFSEKADKEAEEAINRREAEVDWPGNRTMDYQSKELSNKRMEEIPLQARNEIKKQPNRKKAILVSYEGMMDDIIDAADPSIKSDLKNKKDKILKDLKSAFQIEDSKKDSSDDYIYLNGDKVTFHYENLPITTQYLVSPATYWEPADWEEKDDIINYDYEVDKDSIIDFITVKFLDENEIIDSDDKLNEYLDKYEKELIKLFREEAIEDAEDKFDLGEYYEDEKANSEYERKKEMNDSEEKIYFDNDGDLVIQYIFRKMPYGYTPKLNQVYDFLASLIRENAAEFKDVNVDDVEALNEYIYENGRKLSNRFGKEIIEKFRDDAETEFYAKLFDNED